MLVHPMDCWASVPMDCWTSVPIDCWGSVPMLLLWGRTFFFMLVLVVPMDYCGGGCKGAMLVVLWLGADAGGLLWCWFFRWRSVAKQHHAFRRIVRVTHRWWIVVAVVVLVLLIDCCGSAQMVLDYWRGAAMVLSWRADGAGLLVCWAGGVVAACRCWWVVVMLVFRMDRWGGVQMVLGMGFWGGAAKYQHILFFFCAAL